MNEIRFVRVKNWREPKQSVQLYLAEATLKHMILYTLVLTVINTGVKIENTAYNSIRF